MAASAGGVRAGRAYVELATRDDGLTRGLKTAEKKLRAWGTLMGTIGKQFLAAGLGGAAGLGFATKLLVDYGSELTDMSARTGVSVEALSAFRFAAEQTGATLEDVEGGVRKMQKSLVEAASGSKEARQALSSIGLSLAQLRGLSPDEQFRKVAAALAKLPNPANRTAAAMAIMGKSATKLLPMMMELAEEEKRFKELGLGFTAEDAAKADALGDSWGELMAVLKRTAMQIAVELAPALKSAFKWTSELTSKVISFVRENKGLVFAVTAATTAFLLLGGTLVGVKIALTAMGTIAGVISALGAAPFLLGFAGVVGMAAQAGAVLLTLTGKWRNFFAFMKNSAAGLKEAFAGAVDALSVGDLTLAWEIAVAAIDAIWKTGTLSIRLSWLQAKDGMATATEDFGLAVVSVFDGILQGGSSMWISLGDIWAKGIDGLKSIWQAFANGLAGPVIDAVAGAAKQIVSLMRGLPLVGDSIAGDAERNIDGLALAAKGAVSVATVPEATANPIPGLLAGSSAFKSALANTVAAGRTERNNEMIALAGDAALSAQKLASLQAKARDKAAKAAGAGDAGIQAVKAAVTSTSMGTFLASSVKGLGGGGVQERIAGYTKRTAEGIDKLRRDNDEERVG